MDLSMGVTWVVEVQVNGYRDFWWRRISPQRKGGPCRVQRLSILEASFVLNSIYAPVSNRRKLDLSQLNGGALHPVRLIAARKSVATHFTKTTHWTGIREDLPLQCSGLQPVWVCSALLIVPTPPTRADPKNVFLTKPSTREFRWSWGLYPRVIMR